MWEIGNQKPLQRYDANSELAKADGFMEEKDAKLWLEKFLRENVQFTVDMLMGVELLPFQSMMVKTMMKSDYFLAILSRGASKTFSCAIFLALHALLTQGVHIGVISASFRQCAHPDTLVFTNRGILKLKDTKVGDLIYSINGPNKILDKWQNPIHEGKKITSKLGYSFEGKIGHKVYRYSPSELSFEFVNIEDVKVGDFLPVHKNMGYFGDDDMFDQLEYGEDLAYLFGLIVGDGSIHNSRGNGQRVYRYSITTNDQETIDFLREINKKIFLDKEIGIHKKVNSNCYNVSISSKSFIEFMEFVGLFGGVTATKKTVPAKVLCAPQKYVREFLRGLMDTDGTVYHNKKKNYCIIDFCTSSREMAEQVQMMFLNFGITTKLAVEKARGNIKIMGVPCYGNESYKVRITNNHSAKLFQEKIGFRLTRKQKVLSDFINGSNDRGNYDHIPNVGKFIRDNCVGASRLPENVGKKRIKQIIRDCGHTMDSDSLNKVNSLLDSDFYFERVDGVSDVHLETIDIEVENESCYVGNGFIHHNSKGIMKKILDIAKTPKARFLNDCITRVSLQNDEWNIEIGQSKITALPLGQGEKLRGFRFQVMVMDELLLMPNKIIQEIIVPFLAVVTNPTERKRLREAEDVLIKQGKMKEEDRKVWPSNKLIGLSSASYQFENLYAMYKEYEKAILSGENKNAHYSIFHMAYDAVPKELYDPALLEKAKAEMSEAQMDREFRSIFTSDSSGFFKISKMIACTYADGEGQSVQLFGNKDETHICSIDPSWSQSDASDYFAMQVIKVEEDDESGTLVHPYAIAGGAPKDHIAYFYYVLTNFDIQFIVADFMGGAQFIASCNESELFKSKKIEIKTIDVEVEDPEKYQEDIREIRQQYNLSDKKICILRKPSTTWIRSGNELLQRSLDKKDIMFAGAAMDDDFNNQIKDPSRVEGLKFIREEKGATTSIVDFVENLKDLITLTKTQCAMIEVSSTPTGHQTFDLPKNLKQQRGSNRARKDLYSALVLGNWGKKIFFDMKKMPAEETQATFVPFLIGG